ncbi:MAG: GNAT family N-acetyltransferase [Pseudomonadota bacterium]
MYKIHQLGVEEIDWSALNAFKDRNVFQQRSWLDFVADFTSGDIVVLALEDGNDVVGYFSGVLFKKLGIRLLGSPFRGWMSGYQGFNLVPETSYAEAVRSVAHFAFKELRCWHFELIDRNMTLSDVQKVGCQYRAFENYETDLTLSWDEIFHSMSSSCRRAVRKSAKEGVSIEVAEPTGFAEEYYEQLKDVFAKQNMAPNYNLGRVEKLIEHISPSQNLLLLRARNKDGKSIATGIYPGYGDFGFFWGNASLRDHQILRPNEALHLFAMQYWKSQDAVCFDWGWALDYKKKYGGNPVTYYSLLMPRSNSIYLARSLAEKIYVIPRNIRRRNYLKSVSSQKENNK